MDKNDLKRYEPIHGYGFEVKITVPPEYYKEAIEIKRKEMLEKMKKFPHFPHSDKVYTEEEIKEQFEQADRDMWKGTAFDGLKFTRENEWSELTEMWKTGYPYSSPVFKFENGERVAIDRWGNIVKL